MGAGSFIAPWLENHNMFSAITTLHCLTLTTVFEASPQQEARGSKGSSRRDLAMVVDMDLSQDFSHFEQSNSLPVGSCTS